MDTQDKQPKFKLTKETTVNITIGVAIGVAVGAFGFGGAVTQVNADITQLQAENAAQDIKIENNSDIGTDIRLDLIKIRTQLDTLLEARGLEAGE